MFILIDLVKASLKFLTWLCSQLTGYAPDYLILKRRVGTWGLAVLSIFPLVQGWKRTVWLWGNSELTGGKGREELVGVGGTSSPGAPVKPGCCNINTISLTCMDLS